MTLIMGVIMPRGYTTIMFIGGSQDGRVDSDVSLRGLPKKLLFRHETFTYTDSNDNSCVGKGSLNSTWQSYKSEVYLKLENEKHIAGTVFKYAGDHQFYRCQSLTQKATQCSRVTTDKKNLYCTLHRPR